MYSSISKLHAPRSSSSSRKQHHTSETYESSGAVDALAGIKSGLKAAKMVMPRPNMSEVADGLPPICSGEAKCLVPLQTARHVDE